MKVVSELLVRRKKKSTRDIGKEEKGRIACAECNRWRWSSFLYMLMWDEFKIIRFKCQREWCFKLFRNRRNMRQPTPDFIFVKSNKTPCPWNTNFSSSSSYFDLGETSVLFPSFCLMWSHIFRGRQKMDFTSMFLLTVFSNNLTLIIWDHILNYFYGPHDVSRGSHCIYRMQKNEKLKLQ